MEQRSEVSADLADRRRTPRSDTHGLVLELYWAEPTGGVARLFGRRGRIDSVLVKVVDLSLGGARIEVPGTVDLQVGQVVELAAEEDCRIGAVVRHLSGCGSRMAAGLEFTTARNAAISAFFERLLSRVESLGLRWDDLPVWEKPMALDTFGPESGTWLRDDRGEEDR